MNVRLGRPLGVISGRPQDVKLGRSHDGQIGSLGDVLGTLEKTNIYRLGYYWLLLVTSRYFLLLLVPRFSND